MNGNYFDSVTLDDYMDDEDKIIEHLKYRIVKSDIGTVYYNSAGEIHRDDGPAVIYSSGSQLWYKNGLKHRIDGPAGINHSGYKTWWLEGIQLSEEHWLTRRTKYL